ncbi:MAG TPA: phospho-sugar mutase [Spirochaetota bacterium]|nr:phospho-sugar mutase [Spirochaetota bacterium]
MPFNKEEILKRAIEWTKSPFGEECRNEIQKLIDDNNEKELAERFAVDLDFGTGGMRGIIRNGANGMNIYVVSKATQGLANYVNSKNFDSPKAAIAYDSRKYSKEFAQEAAAVLASNGIKTYIFKDIRPTPELSFAVREFGCVTGIVITASHNPKEYNGYKVYWKDGAQVINPDDKAIISEVRKVVTLNDVKKDDFEQLVKKGAIEYIDETFDDKFLNSAYNLLMHKDMAKFSDLKIVYTPLHGTGGVLIPKALNALGYKNVFLVDKQMIPDPDFSTVKSPNPEDKVALEMGIDVLLKNDADILIATDPDADRMGVVVRDKTGGYIIITGNQIGAILEYYLLSELKKSGKLPKNAAVVKTVVTSNLQDVIGEYFGVKVFNVLTGFKFIADKINNFEKDGNYTYIFGCEESYGYLPETYARDKDSISSALIIAECAAFLKSINSSIADYLETIFRKFGYFYDETESITIGGIVGMQKIRDMMTFFKNKNFSKIGDDEVVKKIDYEKDTVYDSTDGVYTLPKSNVIQYLLGDNSKITIRPSGTEPKIKLYYSTKADSKSEAVKKVKSYKEFFKPIIEGISK